MAKREPATSTQLKAALSRIAELEKKLKDATDSKDTWYRAANEKCQEIDQIHSILDAIPSAPARLFETPTSYGQQTRSVLARLAGYFATRS